MGNIVQGAKFFGVVFIAIATLMLSLGLPYLALAWLGKQMGLW